VVVRRQRVNYLTVWRIILLVDRTVPPLANKFLTFYGTRKLTTVYTRTCPIPSQINPIHAFASYLRSILNKSPIFAYVFQMVSCFHVLFILTPCSRVLVEKLTVSQLIKKFPAYYGTRRFITALTSAHHLSLS